MKKKTLLTLLPLLFCLWTVDALADPINWTLTPKPNNWHFFGHASVPLDDGTVLVTGGRTGAACSACLSKDAEVYDAAKNEWSPVAKMSTARHLHTATKLPDGRVLVTGGVNKVNKSAVPTAAIATAEVYDPVTRSWAEVATMSVPRAQHSATLLADGRIFVAGGGDSAIDTADVTPLYKSAAIYDPAADTWTETATMSAARAGHTATLLHDGRVLLTGGRLGDHPATSTDTAEIYDPAAVTWSETARMTGPRYGHTAIELADHRVLVAGGLDSAAGTYLASVEIFDPTTDTWTEATPMNLRHMVHAAVLLPSGDVLVSGGYTVGAYADSRVELYDAVAGTWRFLNPSIAGHYLHTATLTGNDVLLVGGPSWSSNAEVLRLRGPGEACDGSFQCGTGFCVEGMCCDSACDGCRTCTAAAGAARDGVCSDLACGSYTCEPTELALVCLTECATSSDCAAGFVCEPGTRNCVLPRSTFVDEGCAFSPADHSGRGALALLAVTTVALLRRRARDQRAMRSGLRVIALLVALLVALPLSGCTAGDSSLCGAGLSLCGDQCTDVATDRQNCGACDNACSSEELCLGGRCALGCSGGTIQCGGRCADPGVDPENCGACGATCEPGQICSGGRCELPVGLTSYLFPQTSSVGESRPRDVPLVLAAEGPAMIYYTTDGSTPVPGAHGTEVGVSPVTLPPVLDDSVFSYRIIQWFADYASLGRETVVHYYVARVDPDVKGQESLVSQDLKLDGADGPVITVPAGATVSGKVFYQIWTDGLKGTCPFCILQYVLGADGVDKIVGCETTDGYNTPYPGKSGTIEFSFKAPDEPGRHFLRNYLFNQSGCHKLPMVSDKDAAVGLVIVY